MSGVPNNTQRLGSLDRKDYQFFLERIPKFLGIHTSKGYFWLFTSLTVAIEACRLLIDYVTIVWQLGLSIDVLIVYWTDRWLLFLWPICMLLMYYFMRYLRNCALQTLEKIQSHLKEYPVYALKKVYCGRWQHFFPVAFIIICFIVFGYDWCIQPSAMIGTRFVKPCEMALKWFYSIIIVVIYGWVIGGYFSHACIGIIPICCATSRRVDHIDVFNFDRAGGLGAMGTLAMKAVVLYIFSVSFMTASKGDNKGIIGIIALRQLAESMREYPFNLQMLAKVGSSAIIPLLIVLLQKAAELALGAS